jgi:hypothetical protein
MERTWSDAESAVCHLCGQTFSSQEIMLMHLTRAHEEDGLASDLPKAS